MAVAFEEGDTAMPLGDMGEGEGLEAVSVTGVISNISLTSHNC